MQVVRSGVTFKYGANGPEGLVTGNKKIYVVSASGGKFEDSSLRLPSHFLVLFTKPSAGTPRGSANDFYSAYLRKMLQFIGLSDLVWVCEAATGGNGKDASVAAAIATIDATDFSLPLRNEL